MSDLLPFLPWQQQVATTWLSQRERFAHAWLIHGLAGIGKRQFAMAAAASLLCESSAGAQACGHCAACQWLTSGSHPDLRRIRPDALAVEEGAVATEAEADAAKKAPSKDIRVDQLRALGPWFNTATHRGGWRVAVLYPAKAMNNITANALLKVLEEPPAHTVFLLVADAPDLLLPTLVSRCRRLPLPVPSTEQSLQWLRNEGIVEPDQWLAAAGGAPILARDLARKGDEPCPAWLSAFLSGLAQGRGSDVGALADQLEKTPTDIWVDALQRAFVDLSLASVGMQVRYFPALSRYTESVAAKASAPALAETVKWLAHQRKTANHPLNAKLLTHSALQRSALACAPVR